MITQQNKKGFTIIEVVLVLAIAGLIFLMVFVALPALQRGQRDSQRRSDISRFMSQINSYQTNNGGRVPSADKDAMGKFLNNYMKRSSGEFVDPQSGNNYTVGFSGNPSTSHIIYATQTRCNGEEFTSAGSKKRAVAVRIKLEGSGIYCQDNQ
ncbi:type II secretion system protein [TM7 phylum sp. oral taxon 353]|nr:type II secretion system protein [TM7 phylum sp. oral taxon 353]